MLRNVNAVLNYVLLAQDGEIGRCNDFLFDDEKWTIRYMVADTRKWLPGRKVLISPLSLGKPDWSNRRFEVELTRRQIKGSPALDEDVPVSRQYELIYGKYYGTPLYWNGANIWGTHPTPSLLRAEQDKLATDFEGPEENHLRSIKEVTGYHIEATDGEIGHVEDFVVDDEMWVLRYVVVDTRNWLPGRKVLVPPQWATAVDWAEEKLWVDLATDRIKNSPNYDPLAPINRDYERNLHDYYGRPVYWD
jgi:hypothetical protein